MSLSPNKLEQEPNRRVGSRLGKYLLVSKLGEGGMGVVYEAEDETLKRRVALKILAGGEPREIKRFVAEAQAAARLNHPNVVTVYEVSQFEGQHFLAMELVRGMSAAAYLRTRGPLEWKLATRVLIAACRGLAAAHREGLIHRDLKPGNILLSKRGDIKIADFGLAKWLGSNERSMTAKGTVLGTPEYMSPEQCSSDVVTAQSDLYSLGACYFALLTGRPPFVCEQPVQMMFAHCSQPVPDPRELVPEIPPACVDVIRRAMAKQPHERFADAASMQAALEGLLKQSPSQEQTFAFEPADAGRMAHDAESPTLPVSRLKLAQQRGAVIGVTLTLLAILIGIAIARWGGNSGEIARPDGAPAEAAKPASVEESTPARTGLFGLATRDGHVVRVGESDERVFVSVAISPNGRYLAARVLGRREGRLMVWDMSQRDAILDRREPEYSLRDQPLRINDFVGTRLLAFTRASDWLMVGELNGLQVDLEAWPIPTKAGDLPRTLDCGRAVRSLAASPTRDELAVSLTVPNSTSDESLIVFADWPREAARSVLRLRTHATACNHLSFDAAGEFVQVSNGQQHVRRISMTRPGIRPNVSTELTITAMAASPLNERTWMALGGMNLVDVRDAETQQQVAQFKADDERPLRVAALEFSADARTLFVAGDIQGTSDVIAFDTDSWTRRAVLGTSLPLVSSLAVSSTQPLLVTGSTDGTLRLWLLDGVAKLSGE